MWADIKALNLCLIPTPTSRFILDMTWTYRILFALHSNGNQNIINFTLNTHFQLSASLLFCDYIYIKEMQLEM